ncbi:MAG: hypothetical protein ACOYOR_05135 [Flavobacterium psychrophilum]
MINTKSIHNFHIPVMGLAYTIDSPIRVAHFGISSVISITDDELTERMRAYYCSKYNLPYAEISKKKIDHRAERISEYLNLVKHLVQQNFSALKKELVNSKTALANYIEMLPKTSAIKTALEQFYAEKTANPVLLQLYLDEHLLPGDIDVNIMTKVDKDNYHNDEQLPIEYNDAHAALRGFAESELHSSVVLSAGMNPRLYSYFENFPDFFPTKEGQLKKKIILKVSDFRSAMIQGNFLAKKGLWVSEYRIESGLNCGGHAFATEGFLLGPILEEFKTKKTQLIDSAYVLQCKALEQKGLPVPAAPLALKITAQGGVGTAEEHDFLLDEYKLDSIGWGSPFLLVPEATMVDKATRELLINAKKADFFLSNISPLGIPFNSIKGSSNEYWKQKRIADHKAGSACPKKLLALSKEFDPKGTCTASKKYQDIQLALLENQKDNLSDIQYQKQKNKITEKSCLCVGLVNSAYLDCDIPIKGQQQGVVICPGPNLAYFDKEVSLQTMVQFIYGKLNILSKTERSHVFINELSMYLDYIKKELTTYSTEVTAAQLKKWTNFKANLEEGVTYYEQLFAAGNYFKDTKTQLISQLKQFELEIKNLAIPAVVLN